MQSTVLASWLGSWVAGGALTGAQIDAIVAGPDRPAPTPRPIFPPPKSHVVAVERPPLVSRMSPTRTKTAADARTSAAADARARKDAYTELTEAAAERGNMLDGLSETLGRMGTQAGEMATQAKRIAQKEGAKSTARSFFRF
jgi:syntaxin-binding protein 5